MINTLSTPPLGAAASRPPPPSSPAHLPSPMNYLIVVFSSSPQVKTGQRTQRCRCPLYTPVNPIVTLIIARGRRHHCQVVLPALAVPPLPPLSVSCLQHLHRPYKLLIVVLVVGLPLLCQGRWGWPSSLGRRRHVLWRAVVVRTSPPRPLLGGSTSGLHLGGYKWPRLCRPYYKMLIVVLVAVPSFIEGGGDGCHH